MKMKALFSYKISTAQAFLYTRTVQIKYETNIRFKK